MPSSPRLSAALLVAKIQRVRNCRAHTPRDVFQSQAKGLNAPFGNRCREIVRVHRKLVENPNDLLAGRCQRVLYLRDPNELAAAFLEVELQEFRTVGLRPSWRA
jgi:hypothetical protein